MALPQNVVTLARNVKENHFEEKIFSVSKSRSQKSVVLESKMDKILRFKRFFFLNCLSTLLPKNAKLIDFVTLLDSIMQFTQHSGPFKNALFFAAEICDTAVAHHVLSAIQSVFAMTFH